jgi:MSHA biogenesis protein MshJ
MNAALARLRARYLKLSRRERALVVAATLVVGAGLSELLFVDPTLRQRSLLLHQIAAQEVERDGLRKSLSAGREDQNAILRSQLVALNAQLRANDNEFRALQSGLVQPQHMGELLKSLLAEHRSLQLLGLRTLPVSSFTDVSTGAATKTAPTTAAAAPASAAAASNDEAWLYRHAVEIRVQGSYADMLAYLRELENLPRHVHWGDLEIDARSYPANVMTVTIFTVSLEKSWWVL